MAGECIKFDVTLAEWLEQEHHVTRSGSNYYYWGVPGDKSTRVLWAGPKAKGKKMVIRSQHEYLVHCALFHGDGVTDRVMADYQEMQADYDGLMETYEREAYAAYMVSVEHYYREEREREMRKDTYG
jgi:hypothetical protein